MHSEDKNLKDIEAKAKSHQFTDFVEDVAGGEFLGVIDMVEVAGSQLEFGLEVQSALRQYWQSSRSDYGQTFKSIKESESAGDLISICNTHIEQRLFHGIDLAESIVTAAITEQKKIMEEQAALWLPFFNILGQDIRGSA